MATKKRKMTRKANPKAAGRRKTAKKAVRKAPKKSARKTARRKAEKAVTQVEQMPLAVLEIVETTVYREPEIQTVELDEDLLA